MTYECADGYKIRDQSGLYFMAFNVEGWIDLFTRKWYRDIFIKNRIYCQKEKGLRVGAYVLMSNHAHVIWHSLQGKLSDTIRDFMSYSTKLFMEAINKTGESSKDGLLHMFKYYAKETNQNKNYKLWTNKNHPEEIRSEKFLKVKLNCIHDNPVRAGWIKEPGDYIYSSASDYISGKGIMEIDYCCSVCRHETTTY